MIGKKNIVFGFLFLATTAALGPLMVYKYQDWAVVYGEKQQALGRLQQLKADNFEENLEAMTADQIARANTEAILALNKLGNADFEIDYIKGGPHAHGNLESVLNILVGLVLCFIAAPRMAKQLISWLFILGTLLHSGMLFLERVFFLPIPPALTGVGAVMILLGLVLTGAVAYKHLRGELVRD